jgi:hypothetical protein
MSPKELDAQSVVHIDEWIEMGSERCKELDQEPHLTKYMMRAGFQEPAFLFADNLGRIWGKGNTHKFYPFHITVGEKHYGFRMSVKAVN